jgi:anaerobic selenocysteine-containing dehydrogenase
MKVVRGCCPLDCPDTCSWEVTVDDAGRAVDLRGLREHPFTRGALCGKVNHYLDALYAPDRLLHPLRRVGAKGEGRFERCSWDEALDLTAAGILQAVERHGPESVLPYFFAGSMGEVQSWRAGPRMFGALGASRLQTTICTAAVSAALRATHGASVGLDPEDLAHSKLILLWGTNPLATNVHQWRFVLSARAQGAHVVTIDPLRSATAERSDEHVALLPGTDAALALGLLRCVLDEGAADRAWLEAHTVGWPELEARLSEWPVERAAGVCGLPVETVRALGRRLATTRPTGIRIGLGLQRHGGAAAAIRTVLAIPAVTGDWRHLGGGAASMTGGHFPLSGLPRVPGPDGVPRAINMSRIGHALTALDDPPVAAMVVFNTNPAASAPNQELVHRGLAREDLFVCVLEHRLTDTTRYADVVLPATMQTEHLDLVIPYGHLYLEYNEPASTPPGECLPNSEIFRRLAPRLGLDDPRLQESDEEIVRQILDTAGAREAGLTFEALREHGYARAPLPPRSAPFAEGHFPTSDGKVHLRADELVSRGLDPLVGFVPPHEILDEELAARYPLVLLSPASRFFLNSTFASTAWHRRQSGQAVVHLHPDDASARRISDGTVVQVFNDRGRFEAVAAVSEATRPGVAFTLKQQWPGLSRGGRNVNATTPERDADLGGAPTFHDNRVEVASL